MSEQRPPVIRSLTVRTTADRDSDVGTRGEKYLYVDVELKSIDVTLPAAQCMDVREFKLAIMTAIQSLFGEHGLKMLFDILKYRPRDRRAFIRLYSRDYVKFHLCLTMMHQWKEMPCRFEIHKTSLCLSSLVIPVSFQDNIAVGIQAADAETIETVSKP